MDKIDKTVAPYIELVDENNTADLKMVLLKNMVDKINEIIDWINSQ
tara:strand:+ start:355 stop:492 length:138 start_codon:yes stop_codon:yes gene_type:complete